MTKAEIIRKLAKRVGVQDLDAKIFFEVFLRKVSLQLNPGETIRVKNIGYFQMRTGKIKNISVGNPEHVLADLIVYHPLRNDIDEAGESLIFNIPFKTEEEYNVIDSYFSLSFGKPVIPLKNANVSEYFIPPSGNELRRLFDTKADKLLQEVEVIEDFAKGEEILLIDSEHINPNQMEINWDEINAESASPGNLFEETTQNTVSDNDAFSWAFGEELEKQIEEEALLDTGTEDNLFVDYEDLKGLSWDFGENIDTKEEPPIPPDTPHQDEIIKDVNNFQRVNSFTTDFNIEHNKQYSPENIPSEDSDLLNSINEELNDEGFAEIKHVPRNYQIERDMNIEPDELPEIPAVENELNILNNEIKELDNNEPLIPEPFTYKGATIKQGYSNKKGLGFFVILAVLLVLTGTVFLYIKVINPYYAGHNKVAVTKVDSYNIPPVIIERDYSIPVTYPYTKDSNIVHPVDPIDKSVFAPPGNTKNNDSVAAPPQEKKKADAPVKQTLPAAVKKNIQTPDVKVKQFIYKSGNKYVVQISSWASKSRALEHAAHFTKMGYQTGIEMANLDRGVYYRVRVGNFNSEIEAQKFYDKYK
jgi:cell division septation protein DedD/nucleoid DNA-binding protein